MYGGTYSTATCGFIYIYTYNKVWRATSGRRTPRTPAGGGRADTTAGGGQAGATLRMGVHACAMGERGMRREPQRGGREDVSTNPLGNGRCVELYSRHKLITVSVLKPLCDGHFNSKTAARWLQKRNRHLNPVSTPVLFWCWNLGLVSSQFHP
jgi:hypothetical protein